MTSVRSLAALAVAAVSLSAFAAEGAPDPDAALANALLNNPVFVHALVDALKRDPAALDALVREARSGKGGQNAGAKAADTTATSTPGADKVATAAEDATRNPLDLPKRKDLSPDGMSRAVLAAAPSSPASGSKSSVQLEAGTGGTSTATISLNFQLDQPKIHRCWKTR